MRTSDQNDWLNGSDKDNSNKGEEDQAGRSVQTLDIAKETLDSSSDTVTLASGSHTVRVFKKSPGDASQKRYCTVRSSNTFPSGGVRVGVTQHMPQRHGFSAETKGSHSA